jgi:dolichol kinase
VIQTGPRLAADGLPWASVTGILVGQIDGILLLRPLNVGAGASLARIMVVADTTVFAQEQIRQGDASLCTNGDNLFVTTVFDGLGRRIATSVYANIQTYWGTISAVAGSSVKCATASYGDAPNSSVDVTLTPATTFDPRPPQVGDYAYVMATMTAQGVTGPIWATQVLVSSSW